MRFIGVCVCVRVCARVCDVVRVGVFICENVSGCLWLCVRVQLNARSCMLEAIIVVVIYEMLAYAAGKLTLIR